MPEYTCPLVAPAGYRLVPESHVGTIEHALMRRIRDLDTLLAPPGSQEPTWNDVRDQRTALVAALTAINPTLAAIWTREARSPLGARA